MDKIDTDYKRNRKIYAQLFKPCDIAPLKLYALATTRYFASQSMAIVENCVLLVRVNLLGQAIDCKTF